MKAINPNCKNGSNLWGSMKSIKTCNVRESYKKVEKYNWGLAKV